jgi:hypothetical protein
VILWSVHTSRALERSFSNNMGSVLSTPYLAKSRVITYQCTSPTHFNDHDYSPVFSPILSSVYDPEKIITILTDSDSE